MQIQLCKSFRSGRPREIRFDLRRCTAYYHTHESATTFVTELIENRFLRARLY
jgi:hypothetical protein